jgi:hypothetical protein
MSRWLNGAILTAVVWSQPAFAVSQSSVQARVECGFASGAYVPFSAGRDRCWSPVNGKTLALKAVVACAVQRSDGTLAVTFHFSELPKPVCDNGKVATKEQYSRALSLLGQRSERSF